MLDSIGATLNRTYRSSCFLIAGSLESMAIELVLRLAALAVSLISPASWVLRRTMIARPWKRWKVFPE